MTEADYWLDVIEHLDPGAREATERVRAARENGVFAWQDPPPTTRPRTRDWAAVAALLRESPGRWALVAAGTRPTVAQLVHQMRRGSITAFRPAGHYDATSRVVDGITRVYARYVEVSR